MTLARHVTIPSSAFYADEELPLHFPPGWRVEVVGPQDAPPLSNLEIDAAFRQPIGTPPIRELAKGRRSAAVVVDDLSRPTPASKVLPHVLEELLAAGIPKQEIRIVVGGGSHRPLTDPEVVLKVGQEIAAEYEVTSHNFMSGDLRGLGTLPDGLPVYINRVVADADFKVCVGGIYPHGAVGFGGGSKLILPGVSGFATMYYFHTFYPGRGHAIIENQGNGPDNRDASEAVAELLGLDVVVNMVLNSRRQVAGLFVGHYVEAQRAGARFASQVYATHISEETRRETDLVVTNCYPLDADALQTTKALWMRNLFEKAVIAAINPASDGTCYHGLFSRIDWARFLMQQTAQGKLADPVAEIRDSTQLLVWSANFPAREFTEKLQDGVLFRRWEALIDAVAGRLPADARVAIFPCASIQILARDESEDVGDADRRKQVA